MNKLLNERSKLLINSLFEKREEIAKINLYSLYNFYYFVGQKNLTSNKPKYIAQGVRMLLLLKKYADNKFTSFKDALY